MTHHGVVHAQVNVRVRARQLFQLVILNVSAALVLVKQDTVDIIAFCSIEASEHVHNATEHECFVESPRRWTVASGDDSRPRLTVKVELVDVIEALLILIYTAEDKHGRLGGTGRVSVATFDAALHALELEPHVLLEVERVQVVQGLSSIPATENIHQ